MARKRLVDRIEDLEAAFGSTGEIVTVTVGCNISPPGLLYDLTTLKGRVMVKCCTWILRGGTPTERREHLERLEAAFDAQYPTWLEDHPELLPPPPPPPLAKVKPGSVLDQVRTGADSG